MSLRSPVPSAHLYCVLGPRDHKSYNTKNVHLSFYDEQVGIEDE